MTPSRKIPPFVGSYILKTRSASVDFPDAVARAQIATIHLKKRGYDPAQFEVADLAKFSDGYSGAEIEQAIVSASFGARARNEALRPADVLAEIDRTRPLSVVMAERIDELRDWAAERAVFADDVERPSVSESA